MQVFFSIKRERFRGFKKNNQYYSIPVQLFEKRIEKRLELRDDNLMKMVRDSRSKMYYCVSPERNSGSKKESMVEVLEVSTFISGCTYFCEIK